VRILIACIGRLKDAEEREIVARYAKRFDQTGRALGLGPIEIAEIPEARAARPEARRSDEALRLVKLASQSAAQFVLDGEGKSLSSEAFARLLAKTRDSGVKSAAFLIGGPDGHGAETMTAATVRLSLGPLTLPHGLARVVLVEQLYRAATILAGHPYHRA
jgi:23S rRNA (pseudouridine1915-N3)-methyltransferase